MNESRTNIPKLIMSCCLGASMFCSPAFAVDDNEEMTVLETQEVQEVVLPREQVPIIKGLTTVDDSINLKGGVTIAQEDQRVDLSLRNSDVRQVLRMLADKAELNIIFHDSVSGSVTLDLVNVSLNKAFEYVLTIGNLRYWVDEETLIIATQEASGKLGVNKQVIKPIKIKYLAAEKIADFLNDNIFGLNNPGLSGDKIVVTNPRKNEILIFGSKKDIALAEKVVDHLDTKPEISTFNVNHIKPDEMADLLCQTVFEKEDESNSSSSSSSDSDGESNLGSGVIACRASDDGESSSKSNSNDDSSSDGTLQSFDANAYTVLYYPENNTISVMGATKEQILLAEEFINKTDKKQPQVCLELSIVELNEDGSKALSSTWAYYNKRWGIDAGYGAASNGDAWDGKTGTPLARVIKKWVPDPNDPTTLIEKDFTIPGGHYLSGGGDSVIDGNTWDNIQNPVYQKSLAHHISFLVSSSKGRTLANPKIIATNNKTSKINLTSEYLARREIVRETTDAGTITTTTYESGDAGIKIEITPTISPNGFVTMDIKPSYSTIRQQMKDSTGGIIMTFLNERELELEDVRVRDGETLIIGGLVQEVETNSVQKVPFLGDLPFIGSLFRSSAKDKGKSELIIMVTPKIIEDEVTEDSV